MMMIGFLFLIFPTVGDEETLEPSNPQKLESGYYFSSEDYELNI